MLLIDDASTFFPNYFSSVKLFFCMLINAINDNNDSVKLTRQKMEVAFGPPVMSNFTAWVSHPCFLEF